MKIKVKLSRYATAGIAVWGFCLVLLGIGYGLFYAPQHADLTELKNQFQQNETQLEKAQLAASVEVREKIQLECEEKSRLIGCFSTEHNAQTELVFEIGQIASELHLSDFSSKHENQQAQSTVKNGLEEAWLEVEFVATFEQFAQFINQLERNCPVVFVEKVFFRRNSEESQGHDVTLMLSFLTKTNQTKKTVALATK